jgi:hypothetical protein
MDSFNVKATIVILLSFVAGVSLAQESTPTRAAYHLFPVDESCACTVAEARTKTLESSELTKGKKVFQVFRDRKSKRELFRLELGSPDLKWWHYGISLEGDFNADGIPDYAWYGGDDTSDEVYVFLSSGDSYKKLDIYKALASEWTRRFHKPAPDFADFSNDYGLRDIRLIRDSTGVILASEFVSTLHPDAPKRRLRVRSEDFVFSEQ